MAQNVYTNCPTIAIGCFLYTDSSLTTPVTDGIYSDGTNVYYLSGGQVISEGLCNPPTTTSTTTIAPTTTTTTTIAPTTTTSTTTSTTTVLIECNSYFLQNNQGLSSVSFSYIDCNGENQLGLIGPLESTTLCIRKVNGFVQISNIDPPGSLDITDQGACALP